MVLGLRLASVIVNNVTVNTLLPSFSDEDFLHVAIINFVLCFVPRRTGSTWPTDQLP